MGNDHTDCLGMSSLCSYNLGIGDFSFLGKVLPQLLVIELLRKAFHAQT